MDGKDLEVLHDSHLHFPHSGQMIEVLSAIHSASSTRATSDSGVLVFLIKPLGCLVIAEGLAFFWRLDLWLPRTKSFLTLTLTGRRNGVSTYSFPVLSFLRAKLCKVSSARRSRGSILSKRPSEEGESVGEIRAAEPGATRELGLALLKAPPCGAICCNSHFTLVLFEFRPEKWDNVLKVKNITTQRSKKKKKALRFIKDHWKKFAVLRNACGLRHSHVHKQQC